MIRHLARLHHDRLLVYIIIPILLLLLLLLRHLLFTCAVL